jgi:hypothetical protein
MVDMKGRVRRAVRAMRKELKLTNGADSGSKKFKRDYDDAYGGVYVCQEPGARRRESVFA